MTGKISDFTMGQYSFELGKDKLTMTLNEWTLGAEAWAESTFGDLTKFQTKLMGDPEKGLKPEPAVIVATLIYLLDEDSKTRLRAKSEGGEVIEETFMRLCTYKHLFYAAKQLFKVIHDSVPEDVKKNLEGVYQMDAIRPTGPTSST